MRHKQDDVARMDLHLLMRDNPAIQVLTDDLRQKFLAFHETYEAARNRLADSGASGGVVATRVWMIALTAVPLTVDELRAYKLHVAMHSVNGVGSCSRTK